MKYRIRVKLGENRECELLIYKSNPPLKYQLLNVEFGLETHVEEEKQPILSPFSSNELRKIAKQTTKKHLDLSDDEIDYENGNIYIGNGAQTVAMLDALVKSFEKPKDLL